MIDTSTTMTITPYGDVTTGATVPMNTGGDYMYWPYHQYWYPVYQPVTPTQCAGDIHVFPCPHCATCKCGGAEKRDGKKKPKKC